ncbi:hypothetical protein [Algihabitans albus]|uniref:hypothetical protein n=1 Tax=Algihabitans albus TaxID=2164067 RepID=UPI000E5D90F0|nr:hypothetical protein [Algihabitans albus]
MATHAQLAAHLMRGAAEFFRNVGKQNAQLKAEMDQNARTFELVAEQVEADPNGEVDVEQFEAPS